MFDVGLSAEPIVVLYFVCVFGWLVCQQDYTKTIAQISTKLGWKMGLGPEFGVDPNKGIDHLIPSQSLTL